MASLQGIRVVVTRAVHQADELATPLRDLGADVLLLPTIEIAPPEDPGPLATAAGNCHRYDWIIFTSVNAVQAFAFAMPPNATCKAKIAAIGEATRQTCDRNALPVLLTPPKYVAESLVEAFADFDLHDRRILIPSAAVTRDVVPLELRKLGALVHVVEAYRNIIPANTQTLVDQIIREPYPDWVLFASASALKNLVTIAGAEPINRMKVASIGPATSAAACELGVQVTAEARVHDRHGLVDAIANFYFLP